MAAIDHQYVETTSSPTTTSSTYATVTGMSVASGNFTAGKKYLLLCSAHVNEDSSGIYKIRLAHGGTGFGNSTVEISTSSSSIDIKLLFWEVWTAVGGEAITVEHAVTAGNGICTACSLLVINLSDDLTENTDWFLGSRANDDALTTSPIDGGSVTFTPAQASTWLILSFAQYQTSSNTVSASSNITRSGEASSSEPSTTVEPISSSAWIFPLSLMRAFDCTAVSNTFKEVSVAGGSVHTRRHSQIFALNLSKFRTIQTAYTSGTVTLNTPDYGSTIQTLSIQPAVTGNICVLAGWSFDKQNSSNTAKSRVQVDGTDAPATLDRALRMGADNTDEDRLPLMFVDSLNNTSHTIDLQASVSATTSTPVAQQRSLVAFSLELLAGSYQANPLHGLFGKALVGKL